MEAYRIGEADLIDSMKMRLLANMADEARLAKAPPNHLAFAFNSLFNAGRLLRNQSTANIGLRQAIVMEAHQQLPGGVKKTNRTATGAAGAR